MIRPSPVHERELALARRVRCRCKGPWRPSWGRIAAILFSIAFWWLVVWVIRALFGAAS